MLTSYQLMLLTANSRESVRSLESTACVLQNE
jgi:hypothetical protein